MDASVIDPITYPGAENRSGRSHSTIAVDNVEENRLQIFFPEIPSESLRTKLEQSGFRWSPSTGAWERHRSQRVTYLAKLLLTQETQSNV